MLGSLYASSHRYKMVYWSFGLSIHQSVCHACMNVNKNPYFLAKLESKGSRVCFWAAAIKQTKSCRTWENLNPNNIFGQIDVREGLLDVSSNLYERICPSVSQSVSVFLL